MRRLNALKRNKRLRKNCLKWSWIGIFLGLFPLASFSQNPPIVRIDSLANEIDLNDYIYVAEDTTSQLTFEDIYAESPLYQPLSAFPEKLNPDFAYWAKLTIRNELDRPTDWMFYPDWVSDWGYNSFVEVYIPKPGGGYNIKKSGRFLPASEKDTPEGTGNKISLTLKRGEQIDLYIRVWQINNRPPVFNPKLIYLTHWKTFNQESRNILQAIFQGMLWMIILYTIMGMFGSGDVSNFFYILYILSTSIYFLYLSGLFPDLFLQENPTLGLYIWIISSNLLAISYFQFARSFLETAKHVPWWDRLAKRLIMGLMFIMGVELMICRMTYDEQLLNNIINVVIILEVSFLLIVILRFLRIKDKLTRIFIVGTLCLVFAGAFGVIVDNLFDFRHFLFMIEMAFIAELLTFSYGLGYRESLVRRQKLEAQERLNEQLVRADKLKDQFLANTSHELRTPLNGIIGISEYLFDEASKLAPKDMRENLGMVIASCKRLTNLVNDILDFSKIKVNELTIQPKPLDLYALADIVVKIHGPLIKRKSLEMKNEIPKNIPPIMGDENRIVQIFHNLVGNAIKFTEKGSITLRTKVLEEFIEVSIKDTGIGIPKDKQDGIFNEFEQVDGSSVREFQGTGLGLSITKSLVELHKGQIWVESNPDEKSGKVGSTFFITLPLATDNSPTTNTLGREMITHKVHSLAVATEPEIAHKAPPVDPDSFSSLIRILVVDDEPINHQVLRNHLSDPKYKATFAMNGEEVLKLIDAGEKFDLILLDIMMPKMSGYEVCQRIRQKYLPSELPIIMVTAKNQVADLVEGFSIGANDYLVKPFTKAEFLARVNTHLHLHRIHNAAARFIPYAFLRSLGHESILDVKLGDQVERVVSVLFSDIRDYTSLAESKTPTEIFEFINTYLGHIGPIIIEHDGFVNQYYGDGIMALFMEGPDSALKSAIRMQEAIHEFNQLRSQQDQKPIRIGIGLHTGPLMMGIIGDQKRMDTGVVADAVNTASRMEGLTKIFGASIILSEFTVSGIPNINDFGHRYLGKVQVKGRAKPIGIYECYEGDSPEIIELKNATKATFQLGLDHYYKQEFEKAMVLFSEVTVKMPHDLAVARYIQSTSYFMTHGTPENWTGVDTMEIK